MAAQHPMGSYRARDYGCLIALLALSMIPMMVFYLYCQRHIIEGVMPGAVKGQKRKEIHSDRAGACGQI